MLCPEFIYSPDAFVDTENKVYRSFIFYVLQFPGKKISSQYNNKIFPAEK